MASHLIYLAVADTTLDKLARIPRDFWIKLGLGIVGVVLLVIILRKVFSINKFVLGGIIFIAGGLVFFNWIYYRTEPKFLTPLVNRIAPFFPSAGAYETRQSQEPKH